MLLRRQQQPLKYPALAADMVRPAPKVPGVKNPGGGIFVEEGPHVWDMSDKKCLSKTGWVTVCVI